MPKGLGALEHRLTKLTEEVLGDKSNLHLSHELGKMGKDNAHSAGGKASLGGDWAFSRWPRSELGIAYAIHGAGKGVTIHRAGRSAGPWRVAEEGRAAGLSRGRKGGKRGPVRAQRNVGAMAGFGAWTAYARVVDHKIDPIIKRHVKTSLSRAVIG